VGKGLESSQEDSPRTADGPNSDLWLGIRPNTATGQLGKADAKGKPPLSRVAICMDRIPAFLRGWRQGDPLHFVPRSLAPYGITPCGSKDMAMTDEGQKRISQGGPRVFAAGRRARLARASLWF